jgi:lipopolysaccharide transport system ATP-binding protein
MGNSTIKVHNLGKAYRIGLLEKKSDTFIGAVLSAIISPFKNFRKLAKLKKHQLHNSTEDIYWANRNISFEVKQGEILGVIGKNGAGKSTLLKMLSRITEPTEGKIEIHARSVASLLEVGTGFNAELTGSENIYLNGTILGLTKKQIDERYNDIVEFSGIEKFLQTPVKRYSSGMKVRLAFAVAAHLDPEILIIDEVLAVGDAEFQKKCLGKVQSVASKGDRTVLFVSHDMAAIKSLCTHAIVMQKGTIVYEGKAADAVEYYLKNVNDINVFNKNINIDFRRGNGIFTTTGIEFYNNRQEEVATFITAMELNIKVYYKFVETCKNPVINLIFKNALQAEVMNLSSALAYKDVLKLHEEGFIICNIPKLPLMAGKYSIDVVLKNDFELTDHVENLIIINVEEGDYYGIGRSIETMRDGILIDHSWATQ